MSGAGQRATVRSGFHRPVPHDAVSRVLIVDDSLVTRSIIQRIVESLPGFEVAASVASAGAALEFLRDASADIIILDIEMPDRNGLDALPDLLERSDQACILVLSSHCGDGAPASIRALAQTRPPVLFARIRRRVARTAAIARRWPTHAA
jgi:two-component system chemotaxis response regulator CheB